MTRLIGNAAQRAPITYRPAASLNEAESGARFIRLGAEGDSVRDIQRALKTHGANIEVDGFFGRQTEDAVRAFQTSKGISVDGVVGPETMGRLRPSLQVVPNEVRREGVASAPRADAPRPAGTLRAGDLARDDAARRLSPSRVTLAPANATPEQRYDHYAAIVRANGGQVNPNGQATVLGIRGLSRATGTPRETTNVARYDDTYVVLRDGRAYELRGATHPGQLRSSMSPDVNRDGAGDVGMINPGNYTANPNGPHAGAASWWVRRQNGSGSIPGVRDTNHDGIYSDAERAGSARRGDTLGEILFHQGNEGAPSSIGCMTLPPSAYDDFIRYVGGRGKAFTYTLVDAAR